MRWTLPETTCKVSIPSCWWVVRWGFTLGENHIKITNFHKVIYWVSVGPEVGQSGKTSDCYSGEHTGVRSRRSLFDDPGYLAIVAHISWQEPSPFHNVPSTKAQTRSICEFTTPFGGQRAVIANMDLAPQLRNISVHSRSFWYEACFKYNALLF